MPPTLSRLLADPRILKAGVGVNADLRLVRDQLGIESFGVVELQHLAGAYGLHVAAAGLIAVAGALLRIRVTRHRSRAYPWRRHF